MKVEIVDEYGSHVCWVEDDDREAKKLRRKHQKEIAYGVGKAVGYVGACVASGYLCGKFLTWLIKQ